MNLNFEILWDREVDLLHPDLLCFVSTLIQSTHFSEHGSLSAVVLHQLTKTLSYFFIIIIFYIIRLKLMYYGGRWNIPINFFTYSLGLERIILLAFYHRFAEGISTWRMFLIIVLILKSLFHQVTNSFTKMICRWYICLICIARIKSWLSRTYMLSFLQLSELSNGIHCLSTIYSSIFRIKFGKVFYL